jgi:hypothetical protein
MTNDQRENRKVRALEEKEFRKKIDYIGSTESHIDKLYDICEHQALEIIELKAKFELLERALLRHNHE